MPKLIYTVKTAADEVGVSERTLYRYLMDLRIVEQVKMKDVEFARVPRIFLSPFHVDMLKQHKIKCANNKVRTSAS